MPTPSLIIPSAPVYDEGLLYGLNVYGTNFVPEPIPFTRATTATRTNAAGLIELAPYNLVQYSEMFTDSYWAKIQGTITANTTTAPNGTLTADTFTGDGTNDLHYIRANQPINIGTSYTLSVYAKKNTNNFIQVFYGLGFTTQDFANFDLNNGVVGTIGPTATATITNVGNGWYRCSVTATATSSATNFTISYGLITSATSPRGQSNTLSTSVFVWGAQLVEGTSARDYLRTETRLNIPRIDYSLGGCPNILLEPQRTNVLLNTVFSGSGAVPTSWTQAVGTGTSTLTASTLGVGAQACSQSATAQRPFLSQSFTLVASTTYSYSIYIESISGVLTNDNILLASGLPSGATASYFANGVSVSPTALAVVGRLSITIIVSSTGGSVAFRCGIGTSSNQTGTLLFSRPQLEAGAYSTSFIPTTTASVTRNADSLTRNNIYTNGMITAAGGTWFVEIRNNRVLTRDAYIASLGIGNAAMGVSNGLYIAQTGGSVAPSLRKITGVGTEVILVSIALGTSKIAVKWNGSTADVFQNGVKVISATAFTPTNMEFLFGYGNDVPKYINEMALFPTPLTDAQCLALTA